MPECKHLCKCGRCSVTREQCRLIKSEDPVSVAFHNLEDAMKSDKDNKENDSCKFDNFKE